MMREDKHRRMVRRIVAPPALPGLILPRTAHRPEHIATQDRGAQVVHRLRSKIVIDAMSPITFTLHLLRNVRVHKPGMKLLATNAWRILQILSWGPRKSIERHRKRRDLHP